MVILFQRQLQDDNNAITAEYDLYSDGDEYDSIERQGKADEGSFNIFNNSFNKFKFYQLIFLFIIRYISIFFILGDDYVDYGPQDESEAALGLPSDSRSIRDQLVDEFSCEGRPYGKEI